MLRPARAIGQRERRSPRAAEQYPLLHVEVTTQRFDVGDQQRSGVVGERAVRRRASAAALIEDDDAVVAWVEEPAVRGGCPRTRAAVQEQHRHTARVAGLLPV